MTTHFHYDQDGRVYSTTITDYLTESDQLPLASNHYEQNRDPVGAYLARRDAFAAACTRSEAYNSVFSAGDEYRLSPQHLSAAAGWHEAELRHPFRGANESSVFQTTFGSQYEASPYNQNFFQYGYYPQLDEVRHLHTLQSLLPLIPLERRVNAFQGPTLDIMEGGTDTVFATEVPKKMLILFFGRETVSKLLRTIERSDNEHWSGPPTTQVLRIPQGLGSASAFKILFSWMFRACDEHSMHRVREFLVPQNTYAACTLAQILGLFKLYRDTQRVEFTIMENHFKRPIFAADLEVLWNHLGEHNRFVYAAIKAVGMRFRKYNSGASKPPPVWTEMVNLLERYPSLKARVCNLDLNDEYRPVFPTQWCQAFLPASPAQDGMSYQHPHDEQAIKPVEDEKPTKEKTVVRKAAVLRILPTTDGLAQSDGETIEA
tara:strand:- start:17179 stop:18471 length:1293 start_codon:yes stop_codon:yes gene_type:complete